MFLKLYRRLNRRPLPTVLIWALVIVICAAFALTGFGFGSMWNRVENRLVSIPGSESYVASQILNDSRSSNYQAYLIVTGVDMDKQHAEVKNVLDSAAASFSEVPGVIPAGVLYPFAKGDDVNNPDAKTLMDQFIATDKHGFMMVVLLDLTQFPQRADDIRAMTEEALSEIAGDMRSFAPHAAGIVTDEDLNNQEVAASARQDSLKANLIALLMVFAVLFGATGRLRLALLAFIPSFCGWIVTRTIATLASLIVKPAPGDSALVTMLSLGVVTGYAVFLISRSRSRLAVVKYTTEIPRVSKPRERRLRKRRDSLTPLDEVFTHSAPAMLISTALIVLGLIMVAIFPASSLRWVALVSMFSILGCFAIGTTMIPPLLYLGIRWLEYPRPQWHRQTFAVVSSWIHSLGTRVRAPFATRKLSKPILTGVLVVVLVVLAIPTFGITWHTSGQTTYPPGTNAAKFEALRAAHYGTTAATPDIQVLGKTTAANMQSWSVAVGKIPGVAAMTAGNTEIAGDYSVLDVDLKPNVTNRQAGEIVKTIRELSSDFPKWITGQAANQVDFAAQLIRFVPLLAGVMVLATFLVILRATRRAWAALWATLLNSLNLLVALGLTALVFQDGWGAFLPKLAHSGGVDPNVAVLLAGFGFALSLDYQFYAMNKSKHHLPEELANLDDDPLLNELTQTRGALWTRSVVYLAIFLAFLPMNAMPVKQSAFALVIVVLLNVLFSRLFLSPLLEPYPDQKSQDPDLVWTDEIPESPDPSATNGSPALVQPQSSDTAGSDGE